MPQTPLEHVTIFLSPEAFDEIARTYLAVTGREAKDGRLEFDDIEFRRTERLVPRFEDNPAIDIARTPAEVAGSWFNATDEDGKPVDLRDLPPETPIKVQIVPPGRYCPPVWPESIPSDFGKGLDAERRRREFERSARDYLSFRLNRVPTAEEISAHIEEMKAAMEQDRPEPPSSMSDVRARQEARQKDAHPGDSYLVDNVGSTAWAHAMLMAGHEIRNTRWTGSMKDTVWYWNETFKQVMWRNPTEGGGPISSGGRHWLSDPAERGWEIVEKPETFEDFVRATDQPPRLYLNTDNDGDFYLGTLPPQRKKWRVEGNQLIPQT